RTYRAIPEGPGVARPAKAKRNAQWEPKLACFTGRHLSNGVLHGVSEPIEKRRSDEQFYSIHSPFRQRSGETLARGFLSTPGRKAPSARADWSASLCGGDRERGKSDSRVP